MIIKVNTAYFHSKIVNKPKMSTFITSIQYCTISPSRCNKARKKKGISSKKEVNLSLFAGDIIY